MNGLAWRPSAGRASRGIDVRPEAKRRRSRLQDRSFTAGSCGCRPTGGSVARENSITVRLSPEEREWLRRKAHWEGTTMADLLRRHIHFMIRDEGYLRPPDDEPQDFGYEKQMIEFVNSVSDD